jgi:peptidoglycan/LPS O-acetylase OafA/YrhL
MRAVIRRHGDTILGWLFLIGGVVAAIATRNAMAVVILSAVALPVGFLVALIGGGAVLSTGIWLWLAFALGAAAGIAVLAVLSLYGPAWARNLTSGLFRGTPNGKQGL